MDNSKLEKAEVVLEFALAFIVFLLLAVGGFKIWSEISNKLVAETKAYQAERVTAGQGNIRIPGE